MAILVLGEALIDVIQGIPKPGGAPVNVARAAAALGANVHYAGTVSTDQHGTTLLTTLQQAGVDTQFVTRSTAPTAIVQVAGEPPTYTFSFTGTATFTFPPRLSEQPAWVAYGSVAALREPFATPLHEFLRASTALHMFDPNIRMAALPPGFPLPARVHALAAHADVVRLSSEDLALLPRNSVATWLAGRTQAVILTRGENPATIYTKTEEVTLPTFPATPFADSVGAGDTVTGALLAGLQALGTIPQDVVAWQPLVVRALAAAAVTCTKPGAQPPVSAELTQFLARHEAYR